ncbi:aluminum tubes [Carabus blaptoides fortunei]
MSEIPPSNIVSYHPCLFKMDLQSALVCVLVFVVSAAILLLISMFGMREKSYEEALAEQRQLTSGLLGTYQRPKPKEKKQKKAGKKVKEKIVTSASVETETTEESEATEVVTEVVQNDTPSLSPSKSHVEFEEPPVVDSATTNNKKEDQPLVKQEKSEVEAKPARSAKVKHDKDSADQPAKNNTKKEKKQQPIAVAIAVAPVSEEAEQPVTKTTVVQPVAQPQAQQGGGAAGNAVKDRKKKKSEFNTLQQLSAGDKHDVNVSLLVPLHEAPAIVDEWSEGRADPVQKLKKQLAEKERALSEQQEAVLGARAKLQEVRAELNTERSRLAQNYRNLEETKNSELQAAMARMQGMNQKMQQMNEELVMTRKLRDELSAMQIQRQQLEMHLSQKQDAEATIQSQIGQLGGELQEHKQVNTQLSMELQALRENSHTEKEMLLDRIRQMEGQMMHYKNEADQKQDLSRQLEESRCMYKDLELRINVAMRNESDIKMRCQQHLDEARHMEIGQKQLMDEKVTLQSELARTNQLHKQQQEDSQRLLVDMQSKLSSVQAEKSQLEAANGAMAEDKQKDNMIDSLQQELDTVRSQLQQRESQLGAELDGAKKSLRDVESELQTQRTKNDDLRKRNWKVMEALNVAENALRTKQTINNNDASIEKVKVDEQEKSRKFVQRLFPDIQLASDSSWMSAAENAIKLHMDTLHARASVPPLVAPAAPAVPRIDSGEVAKLQGQIKTYRAIMEDTEGMLNKLQLHVQQEEINWRTQIREKENEIEKLKEQNKTQLKSQVDVLEDKLKVEQQARMKLEAECEALHARALPSIHTKHTQAAASVSLSGMEQMMEEKHRLASELAKEQERCKSLSDEMMQLKKCNAEVSAKVVQNHTANGTTSEPPEQAAVVNN